MFKEHDQSTKDESCLSLKYSDDYCDLEFFPGENLFNVKDCKNYILKVQKISCRVKLNNLNSNYKVSCIIPL